MCLGGGMRQGETQENGRVSKVCNRCGEARGHSVRREKDREPRLAPYCVQCKAADNRARSEARRASREAAVPPEERRCRRAAAAREALRRARFGCVWCGKVFLTGGWEANWSRHRCWTSSTWLRSNFGEWTPKLRHAAKSWERRIVAFAGRSGCGPKPANFDLLLLLASQQFRCPYTGAELAPDDSTEMDHKVPISRGGTNDLSNLQWLSRRANQAKADMTHDEFVALCALVSGRHEGQAGVGGYVQAAREAATPLSVAGVVVSAACRHPVAALALECAKRLDPRLRWIETVGRDETAGDWQLAAKVLIEIAASDDPAATDAAVALLTDVARKGVA